MSAILEELKRGIVTRSESETQGYAKSLSQVIPQDALIAFEGDLGVGKTTFIRGLARAWGIDQPITSPSFNIYAIYQGARQLVHIDAYRLENASDLEDLMLESFLESPYCLAVEWPQNINLSQMPCSAFWAISCSIASPGAHHFRLSVNA